MQPTNLEKVELRQKISTIAPEAHASLNTAGSVRHQNDLKLELRLKSFRGNAFRVFQLNDSTL